MLLTALKPIATLETSLEANYDGRTNKATYRGPSYRSAQKETLNGGLVKPPPPWLLGLKNFFCVFLNPPVINALYTTLTTLA